MVPLNTLGSLRAIAGPETVTHYNNYPSALINGAAAPGFSSSQAIAAMERAAATALPRDFTFEWTGITYQEIRAGSIALLVFGLAIVFCFLILAAQYESWSMPFMVLLAVPLALLGALVGLWFRGMQIDVYSQIGFVMLIGLAAKNAILIVEFAKRRRDEGEDIVTAAAQAARLRLRPILMTAFAFILGVVPLMNATGAGAASRQSLGTTVFGGMLAATVLTLIFVPVFYAVLETWRESLSAPHARRREGRARGIALEPKMRRLKFGINIALIVIALGGAYFLARGELDLAGSGAGAAPTAPAPQAMPVPVVGIVKKTIPIYLEYSARTEAIRDVTLQAKVSGYLQEQVVPDGADVKAGDLLYRIDQSDFDAALDLAKAQVERDEASLDYSRSNLGRGNELATSGYLAKDSFDQRTSAVRQGEATLAMSRAAVRTAELNLKNTEIRAPFAGRLGRNRAPEGTLVSSTAGTPLNNLVQLAPIYVTFNPSESELVDIQKALATGKVEAEVFLPGEDKPRHRGELTFIDNAVERSTGTIVARATIDNDGPDAAAGPVCPRPPAHQRAAGCADGAASRARLEPVRQICLCRRQGQCGRAAPGLARPGRGRPRRAVVGRCGRRPGDRRQPAEDLPGRARAADAGSKAGIMRSGGTSRRQ